MTLRLFAAACVLLAAAPPARAQPSEPPPETKADARKHFDQAQVFYRLGRFDDAVREFEEAYRLYPKPALLFNLGQAHRQAGNTDKAIFFFRQYLDSNPEAKDRGEIEALIQELEKAKAATPTQPKPMVEETAATQPPPETVRTETSPGSRGLRTAGVVAMIGGGALVVAGAAFAALAHAQQGKLEDAYAAGKDDIQNAALYSDTQAARDRGRLLANLSIASFVAGGVALVGGGALYYVGLPRTRTIAIAPTPSGIVLGGEF